VFFVAPSDLAQTMGYTGQPTHPEVLTVVDRCIAQIVAAGKVPGHIGNAETVESYLEKGVRFFLTPKFRTKIRGFKTRLKCVKGRTALALPADELPANALWQVVDFETSASLVLAISH